MNEEAVVSRRFEPAGEVTTSRRGAFWVGIEPVAGPLGTVMRGPMFVEWEAPPEPGPGPPWVLVHGGGGQSTDYTTTPDGRPGWSRLLVAQGHTVFVVDRPGHGRSPHHPDVLGPMGPQLGYEFVRPIFVPPPGLQQGGCDAELVRLGGSVGSSGGQRVDRAAVLDHLARRQGHGCRPGDHRAGPRVEDGAMTRADDLTTLVSHRAARVRADRAERHEPAVGLADDDVRLAVARILIGGRLAGG
jgi:pimeloyl-ACP methyl ester carboxylesterase